MKKRKQLVLVIVCIAAICVIVASAVFSHSNAGKPTVDDTKQALQTTAPNESSGGGTTANQSHQETTAKQNDTTEEQSQTSKPNEGITSGQSQQNNSQKSTEFETSAKEQSQTKKVSGEKLSDSDDIMLASAGIKAVCGNSYTSEKTGRKVVNANTEYWNLVVVNKNREYDRNYTPSLSPAIPGSDIELDSRVAPYYTAMYNAAKKEGIYLTPFSGYRRYSTQERNYNNLTEQYMSQYGLSRKDAADKAATVILPPGTSEHNIGLAMDICNVYDSFANSDEYAWLIKHAQDYGFILRYTAEKQSITGIVPEPWHWRFVGVENAKKIKASGLCLEEYLDSLGIEY